MTEKNATNAKIDQHTVNLLLAAKDQADMKMRTALSKHAFYSESVTTSGDADLFDERIVCVLSKSKITQRIIEKVNTLKQANEELLEAAPMYFSRSSNAFKEPLLLNNVVQLHLTINTAVNSRKCTSKQLIKRLARLERETEAKILSAKNDLPLLDELETKLVAVRAEKEQLEKQPNKEFRIRNQSHKDLIAMYLTYEDIKLQRETKLPTKLKKVRVTAGGLIAIKHTSALDDSFKIIDGYNDQRNSLYDGIDPIESTLELNGHLYDEAVVELHRKKAKEKKGTNEAKIRPENEDLVN